MKQILLSFLCVVGIVALMGCGSSSSSSSDDLYQECIATYGDGAPECEDPGTLE